MPTTTDHSPQASTPTLGLSDMGRALRQGLNLPVCALRASMDALTREIPRHKEGRVLLRGALEEVERLDRNVNELMAYAHLPELHPYPTRALEIIKSARRALAPCEQQRVRLFDFTPGQHFSVDAPLLATSLRRILDNALEASADDVLLVARSTGNNEEAQLFLSTVNGRALPLEADWAMEPFRTSKPNHLGLGLTLAKRDVQLHGGSFRAEPLSFGGTRVVLTIPARVSASRAATTAESSTGYPTGQEAA